jgi:hypothetical protein
MDNSVDTYDSEMLITVDRTVAPEEPLLVTMVDPKSGQKAAIGPVILEFLALLEEVATLTNKEEPSPDELEQRQEKLTQANACLGVLREQRAIRGQLLDTLVHGTVKVGLWIDSMGGAVAHEDKVNWAMDYLDRQGAAVHSYIGVKAISAAFDMSFLADRVNALKRSVFLWHFSDSPDYTRIQKIQELRRQEALGEEAHEEMEDLLAILKRAKPAEKETVIAEMLRQLNDPRNKEGEVCFEGDFLHDTGIIQNSYRHVSQLVNQFRADFPHHADLVVTRFNTGVAQQVYRQIGNLPTWLSQEPLEKTDQVRREVERPTAETV